ncbi:MAG TPA: DUF559 domain-containing protein [Microbacterium sp.]|nr:DUF559 domain-containing protein [Microbacterium sp.]
MDIVEWLNRREGGIAHREVARRAGFSTTAVRRAVQNGWVRVVRRVWLAGPTAATELVIAASVGAHIACVSAARRRKWWLPEEIDQRLHLRFAPHSRSAAFDGVAHWTTSIAPAPVYGLVESPEDTLAHLAGCLDPETARVVWESAIRVEGLSVDALRQVHWRSRAAAECARTVSGLSDSGLETIVIVRLTPWGLRLRQQFVIAGRPVDLLIGDRLVVQIDGFAFHSTSAQRTKDVAHDAELRLRGYTVLRFTYAQVVHDWLAVERTIARAVAAGAHLAA